jgi:hypothetical protein
MRRRAVAASLVVLTSLTTLTQLPAHAAPPRPEAVAFEAGGIAVSSPAGALPQRVRGADPAVSPDGSSLAWVGLVGSRSHVFVGALDGSGARQLTGGDFYDGHPDWSRDGTRLAYERLVGGTGRTEIWIATADGSSNFRVGQILGLGPVWSPDGRFLAYNDGASHVIVADTAGRGATTLADALTVWDWSPDGTRLAVQHGGAATLRLDDRSITVVIPVAPVDSYQQPAFDGSGRQLYVNHDHFASKSDLSSTLERWAVSGSRDETFSPEQMDFNGDISVGGGIREQPAATTTAMVGGLSAMPDASQVRLRFARPGGAGVTIRYAVGTTAPATVTDGLDGGQSLGSEFTVLRLGPSTTYSFSVFARDWAGSASPPSTVTTTTPAEVATTLTLQGPGVITYGSGAALEGRLVREDTGEGVGGASLTLLGHHRGQADRVLTTLTTDSGGRYSTRRATSEGTRYTVRFDGAAPLKPYAASALVQVQQRITLVVTPAARVAAGRAAFVTVTVAPTFPGGKVRVAQRVYTGGPNVLTRFSSTSRATVRLDTSRRQASAYQNVVVTPGARRGYLNDPAFATFIVY